MKAWRFVDESQPPTLNEMIATGKAVSKITVIGFDDIADGLKRLERGEVMGRLGRLLSPHV